MRIAMLICTIIVHTSPTCAVEVAPKRAFKKEYTQAQLNQLEYIHKEWDNQRPHENNVIRRWNLVENGIENGLHPDDITADKGSFLFTLFIYFSQGDPHENTLRNVQLILDHNASPHCFDHSGRSTLSYAPTYAIAKCLIDHGANPTASAYEKAPEHEGTMLHHLIKDNIYNEHYYNMRRTPSDVSRMIALYCKAGVSPKQVNGDLLSPLPYLVRHAQAGNPDTLLGLAETLVKVGAPIDAQLDLECSLQPADDPITPIVALKRSIRERAQKAQQEVEPREKMLHATRSTPIIIMLQDLKFLSKDTAGIVALYDFDPHGYYIDQILTIADSELHDARAKRAADAAAQEQCGWCIIQ